VRSLTIRDVGTLWARARIAFWPASTYPWYRARRHRWNGSGDISGPVAAAVVMMINVERVLSPWLGGVGGGVVCWL
jgi:hypothetical protein